MRALPILSVVFGAVAALGLGLLLLQPPRSTAPSSAAPAAPTAGGIPQGHVYTAVAEEPDDINPLTANSEVARRMVLAYTHDALLDTDPRTGQLRPALAAAYELASDGLSCTFTLRDRVVFADGSQLDMADVLFGWELHRAGHLPLGFAVEAYRRVRAVDVIDANRFRVHFVERNHATLQVVGTSWLVAQRRFFVERIAARCGPGEQVPAVDSERFAGFMNQIDLECGPGTGPYWLRDASAWRRRQDLRLVRHEAAWRRQLRPGTWNFAGIRMLWRDQSGGTNAALRGEVDVVSHPQITALLAAHAELAQSYRRLDYDYDQLGVYRVVWNCRRPPFDDVRVRRALGMLFDIDAIRQVFDGRASRAFAHSKPGKPDYPTDLEPLPFDPAAARRLLREAGFDPQQGRPLRLQLLALHGSEPLRRMRELFAAACQQAGIELEQKPRDMSVLVAEKKQRTWDGLLVLQYFRSWGDPADYLHGDGVHNEGGWRSAAVDALLGAARSELDADRRAEAWRRAHTIAYQEQPAALLVHPMASILLHQRIQDAVVGPRGLSLETAWVAAEAQVND
ncbi:MAG: ABC transporter substrate-binding protein [Planctomycetes bacterium]|jgi:cationic peptide transport system substrate-binding protein|nr:ABC transporter substrate-binding protein [Planctomycetota bacterium]